MEKGLSASDICSIIKTCGEHGVLDLSLGEIRVIFKDSRPNNVEFHATPAEIEKQEVFSAEAVERDEVAHKEDVLAQMEIEDPAEFEKLMLAGDLINSKVGDELNEGHHGAEQALY